MHIPSFIDDIIKFGKDIDSAHNSAFDLWSWLPSSEVAKKHHGDYYVEFQPSLADLMREAAMYIHYLKSGGGEYTASEKEWFESCPCGDECNAEINQPIVATRKN